MKLKRITPRTCLWPLTGSLIASFGLSIALTFRSDHHCYAGVCGETLFPLQARLHVVVWYCWIALSVTLLALRAFHPSIRAILQSHLVEVQLPIIGKSLTFSGALVASWILCLYGIVTGIWWLRLQDYFVTRGQEAGLIEGNSLLAAIALTGHYADITMGMVLLPVARNSALSSFFRLSASTTFAFHMIQAYVLFGLVLIHGFLYAAWTAIYNRNPKLTRFIFPLLNPTYFYNEVWPGNRSPLGVWKASLIFTGLVTTLIFLAMFITTLPTIRRKHFNLFYFTHLLAIVAVVIICLHASTMFYCTAPGLAMWVLDWGMRIYELSGKLDSTLTAVGNGWFCLTLPLPRRRLDGCACHSPLAHFHIHHTESSIREIHPFTTITHLATQKAATPSSTAQKVVISPSASDETIMIQFLFRKSKASRSLTASTDHPREEKASKQWTNKLASLVDEGSAGGSTPEELMNDPEKHPERRLSAHSNTSLRLEGPYFTPANPTSYTTVICLVAGTGVSGAIAIAAAFSAQEAGIEPGKAAPSMPRTLDRTYSTAEQGASCQMHARAGRIWRRCIVIWSVRESDYIKLPFFQDSPGLEVRSHLTGKGHDRLDAKEAIGKICKEEPGGKTWVYISGPNPFIESAEKACREVGVAFFGARWA